MSNDIIHCKVVLIGESGVGKTCINKRFIEGTYTGNETPNSSASFSSKTIKFDRYRDQSIKFEVWDTAGQEIYRSMGKIFYKGARAAILVYEITSLATFNEIKKYWYDQIKEYASKDANKFLFYLIYFLLF